MSINALGVVTANISQLVGKDTVAQANAKSLPAPQRVATEDTTSFSSAPLTAQSLTQTALQTFPSRQSKVENLKQQVNSAQYQLDSAKIAESLVNAEV